MGERFAAADLTVGQINAVIKALGGYDAALQLLRGELSVYKKPALSKKSTRNWRQESGVIYLSVISDGTNGLE